MPGFNASNRVSMEFARNFQRRFLKDYPNLGQRHTRSSFRGRTKMKDTTQTNLSALKHAAQFGSSGEVFLEGQMLKDVRMSVRTYDRTDTKIPLMRSSQKDNTELI